MVAGRGGALERLPVVGASCNGGAVEKIVIGEGAMGLCAVTETDVYQRRWRAAAGPLEPLFVNAAGEALGFRQYADLLAAALVCVRRDPREYTTHSLRIGGATALASAGVPEFLIAQLGRWRSLCFRIYCRRDKRLHAGAAAVMAVARPRLPGPGRPGRVCEWGRDVP